MTSAPSSPAGVAAGTVCSVQVGRGAPLGPDAVLSGFVKRPVTGSVNVHELGLEGDEQVDLRVHGGPDKAVYAYAHSHYAAWQAQFPQHAALLVAGGLGENLTIEACDETQVCIHDIVRIGSVTLRVTQPRQPCFKFALRFDDVAMPRAMIRNGYSGWYYQVVETGQLAAGDPVLLLDRSAPHWPIARVNQLIIGRRATPAERAEYAQLTARPKALSPR